MGCDGGTIPKRDELVKQKKKKEEKDKDADLAAKWQFCALASTKLRPPIVSCDLGKLYNKDSVIEFLLNREGFPADIANHIRNLKDVTELKLTEKKDFNDNSGINNQGDVNTQDSRYICPVVGLEMSGKYRFCYLRNCGCVLSERALKEVKSEECHKCGTKFDIDTDVVVLNGNDEDVTKLRTIMEEKRERIKKEKKGKKRKAEDVVSSSSSSSAPPSSSSVINPTASSSLKTTVTSSSSSSKTTKASANALLNERSRKEYSVAKDASASEAYKSLFTSHESAKKKPAGNWVTYNPLYF